MRCFLNCSATVPTKSAALAGSVIWTAIIRATVGPLGPSSGTCLVCTIVLPVMGKTRVSRAIELPRAREWGVAEHLSCHAALRGPRAYSRAHDLARVGPSGATCAGAWR